MPLLPPPTHVKRVCISIPAFSKKSHHKSHIPPPSRPSNNKTRAPSANLLLQATTFVLPFPCPSLHFFRCRLERLFWRGSLVGSGGETGALVEGGPRLAGSSPRSSASRRRRICCFVVVGLLMNRWAGLFRRLQPHIQRPPHPTPPGPKARAKARTSSGVRRTVVETTSPSFTSRSTVRPPSCGERDRETHEVCGVPG